MKKTKTITEKPAPKAKAEKPITTVAVKPAQKKASTEKKPVKKVQTAVSKPVAAAAELTLSERVGMTAGSIWHYLAKNGATPIAKLIRDLPEEEKIIQRSIGWLAQEVKITLDTVDRVETIALKA